MFVVLLKFAANKARAPELMEGHKAWIDQGFADGVFLLTGTGIVPPDEFTLHVGDLVSITISGIGTLENPVA